MEVVVETSHPKETDMWELGKYIPKETKAPIYVLTSTRVEEHAKFMKYHDLIVNVLGLWPFERDLACWIKTWWNPKGEYDLNLSSKCFFMIIFYNLEVKYRVFEIGQYFFQFFWAISPILNGSLQPRKRGFLFCTSLDLPLLSSLGVMD
jgi:hypothetical protein